MNNFYNIVRECNLDSELFYNSMFSWLQGTETILNDAVKTIDKNGSARILPSLDIGLPDDVRRISGGFLTGCYVEWECDIPFIPVDTTVGVCTSSVFRFSEKISAISTKEFANKIDFLIKNAGSYLWNFNLGNHFITIAEDECHSYLVMHSSASEFKKQLNVGLYPVENNWYWKDLQFYANNNRFIRYIKGEKAERFWEIANKIPEYNEARHIYFAELFADGLSKIEKTYIKHHYGMPSQNAVNIGCFLEKTNSVVPIFSALGKNIFLYSVADTDPEVNGSKLIPHGWGKTYPSLSKIEIDSDLKNIEIANNQYSINSDERIKGDTRVFSDELTDKMFYFNLISPHFHGKVENVLQQVLSYSKHGIHNWK